MRGDFTRLTRSRKKLENRDRSLNKSLLLLGLSIDLCCLCIGELNLSHEVHQRARSPDTGVEALSILPQFGKACCCTFDFAESRQFAPV